MNGKELKKVIESTGLLKGSIASAMGISPQALNQFYRTIDLRQETLNKLDDAIRILTSGEKSLSDFLPPAVSEPTASTPEATESASPEQLTAPGGSPVGSPEHNIIEVYARVISDIERMHKQLERELSEVHALKSDLQHLIADLSSSQMTIAAEPINENN